MSTVHKHIADDPDRLEDYVLGRMSRAEADTIAAHASSCQRCSDAISSELKLAAAVRRAGRDAAKARLRADLKGSDQVVRVIVPWPRVLSIAATLAVLIGLGITGRWLTIHHSAPQEVVPETGPVTLEKSLPRESTAPASPPAVQGVQPQSELSFSAPARKEEHSNILRDQLPQPQAQASNQPAQDARENTITRQEYAPQEAGRGDISAKAAHTEAALQKAVVASESAVVPRKPILVTLRLAESEKSKSPSAGSVALSRDKGVPDTSAMRIVLYLPEKDSALLRASPVARWITDDSVSIRLGDSTFGARVRAP